MVGTGMVAAHDRTCAGLDDWCAIHASGQSSTFGDGVVEITCGKSLTFSRHLLAK